MAPVNAPLRWPNNCASTISRLTAAQLKPTNRERSRRDHSWMRRASHSLPTPVSPSSSTGTSESATRRAMCRTAPMPVIATDGDLRSASSSAIGGSADLRRRVVARQSQHRRKALGGGDRGAWFGDDREVVAAAIEQVDAEHRRVVEQVAQVGRRHRAAGLDDKAAGAGLVHDRPSHAAVEIVEQAPHLRRRELRPTGLLEDRRRAVQHARARVAGAAEVAALSTTRRGPATGRFSVGATRRCARSSSASACSSRPPSDNTLAMRWFSSACKPSDELAAS